MKSTIFGLPASGKGTLAAKLASHFNLKHISTGDLIRNCTDIEIKKIINKGEYVPDKFIIKMLLDNLPDDDYLLDGFPRTLNQVEIADIDFAIYIDLPEEIAKERMANRGEGRADDKEDIFMKRLNEFKTKTFPVIEEYNNKNMLIRVNGKNSPEKVFEEALKKISKFYQKEIKFECQMSSDEILQYN